MSPLRAVTWFRRLPRRTAPFVGIVSALVAVAALAGALALSGVATLRSLSLIEWIFLVDASAIAAGGVLFLSAPPSPALPVEDRANGKEGSASPVQTRPAMQQLRFAYSRVALPAILGLSLAVFGLSRIPASNTLWYEELTLKADAATAEWTPTAEPVAPEKAARTFSGEAGEEDTPDDENKNGTGSAGDDPTTTVDDPDDDKTADENEQEDDGTEPEGDPGPVEVDPRPLAVESDPYLIVGPSLCKDIQDDFGAQWQEARLNGRNIREGTFGPTSAGLEVTLENVTGSEFDWWSNIPIAAIIVKADGGDSFVYPYTGEDAMRGLALTVPSAIRSIGHISFCYESEAAEATDEPTTDVNDEGNDGTSDDATPTADSSGSVETFGPDKDEIPTSGPGGNVVVIDTQPQPAPPVRIGPGFIDGKD